MTVSDLNNAIQNIDSRYLDIADAQENKMVQITTNNNKKILATILAACLILGLAVTASAHVESIIRHIFGWGKNMEVSTVLNENGDEISEVKINTDYMTEPIVIKEGRMIFIVNDEEIDITDVISTEEAFEYEYTDTEGITHIWLIGLLENENQNNLYGYAEYLRDVNGNWIGGYSARINIGSDGKTQAKWLETKKQLYGIPW